MKVYIAGPMRGIPGFNFPAFHDAAKRLRSWGHEVVSPAAHDEGDGFDFTACTGNEDLAALGFSLRDALMWDLAQVAECDAVYLLYGWDRSRGAKAELATAAALGKLAAQQNDIGFPTHPASEVFDQWFDR